MSAKPNLFIIGVAKAGTTLLANYLSGHEAIFMAEMKEPDHFSAVEIENEQLYYNTKPIREIEQYEALFEGGKDMKYRGEASVSYFFYKNVSEKIKNYSPNAKLILLLRDPIERALSHYQMDARLGFVKQGFDEIVLSNDEQNPHFNQYISQGLYMDSLLKFKEVFGSNLLVLNGESDLVNYLPKIANFLELESIEPIEVEANLSIVPSNPLLKSLYAVPPIRKAIKKIARPSLIKKIKSSGVFKEQEKGMGEEAKDFLVEYYQEDQSRLKEWLISKPKAFN